MLRVFRVEIVGEAPLVSRETGARAQDAQDFAERPRLVRRVGHGLDGERGVVAIVAFGNPHVVAVDEAAQRPDIPGVMFGALDLVGVVVDADKAGSGIARQIAHRPADSASHIEHLHPRFQGQPVAEKMLVPEQRRLEALAPAPGREVKGLAPAELVEVGYKVVIMIYERAVLLSPALLAGVVNRRVVVHHGLHVVRS